MKNNPWVIEYSFYYEAFGVLRLHEYVKKAQESYAKQKPHSYVILGVYESEEKCRSECSVLQEHRNEKLLSIEYRLKEFQKVVAELKAQLE